jgi:ketosteroid isomerase-like protein
VNAFAAARIQYGWEQVAARWKNSFDAPAASGLLSGTPMWNRLSRGRFTNARPVVTLAATALLLCVPLSLPAQHHRKHETHVQIEDLEHQWQQATLSNDLVTMDKLLSEDYLGITANGELQTKTQLLDRMKARIFAITKMDVSDMKIKRVGAIAIVTSLAQVEGEANGQPVSGSFRYTRVYQHLPSGAWRVTSFEATRIPRNGGRQRGGVEPASGQR